MMTAADEVRADDFQIVREIRENRFRDSEALLPLGFGVLRVEQNAHAGLVELKVSTYRQGCEAAAADGPEAEQDQNEAVAVLDIPLFSPVARQSVSFLH
jgi:hypothetical protein